MAGQYTPDLDRGERSKFRAGKYKVDIWTMDGETCIFWHGGSILVSSRRNRIEGSHRFWTSKPERVNRLIRAIEAQVGIVRGG